MSQVKIIFFQDNKLEITYGALLEFDNNVTKVCYINRDWIGNFTSEFAQMIKKEIESGNIKFQNLEELDNEPF